MLVPYPVPCSVSSTDYWAVLCSTTLGPAATSHSMCHSFVVHFAAQKYCFAVVEVVIDPKSSTSDHLLDLRTET